MAIFSKKSDTEVTAVEAAADKARKAVGSSPALSAAPAQGQPLILLPRMSEKSNLLTRMNKYVFKVAKKSNKVEIRKAVEKQYGVKVASVNIVRMQGKVRRYGRFSGKMSDFKKAIVTLTADSKKINVIEST